MTIRNVDKFNIAMFGHKRIPSREGGIEVVVEELASRMAARGNQVVCYNRSGHHVAGMKYDKKSISKMGDVQIKYVPTIDKDGLAAFSASIFAAIAAAFSKVDIVHIHAEGPAFMCWLPKLLGKKVIVTIHGLDWKRAKWGRFASWYIRSGEKNAVCFADEIIVLSQDMKKYFQNVYGRETVFIPNGVSKPKIKMVHQIKKQWGLEKDGYILFLGRLVPEKGIHYLIEAYKAIDTDKKLVIAGESSGTQRYVNKLKTMGSDVIFTGFQQGEILEELYSNAYIYVLPSDLEGMPISLLEAMSYGNCCLVSNIPECTEVVEDKAAIFRKSNIKDLKEKLKELLANPEEVKRYKKEAASFILQKYSWNDVVEKTLQLYKK